MPVTSRWTRLSYATGIASPADRASSVHGGGEAQQSLVSDAAAIAHTNQQQPQQRAQVQAQRDLRPASPDRVSVAASSSSVAMSETDGPLRQFPITKTFGRASWTNRSWYGRSWHGRSWHASQTFAPPMAKLPDPPLPPPVKYSLMPRTSDVSGNGAPNGQTRAVSLYGTGNRLASNQVGVASAAAGGGAGGGGGGGGAARQMEVPQLVIYSPTPRVSAQTPVIVDPESSDAQVARSSEASQGSMHSGGSSSQSAGGTSILARDGSHENSSSAPSATGRDGRERETGLSLVEVTDIPRPPPATAAAPTTLSRFSQVSDLSSASANTGYSWDDGSSEPYTADRASTLSRIAGGFGLSIVAERGSRNYGAAIPRRPVGGQDGRSG